MMFQDFKSLLLNPKALFLKNIGIKQTVFKNTFWLILAEAITGFLKFIFIIYVARILGATEYGKFTFALSFVSLFTVLGDLGLSSIIIRDFSQEHKNEKEYATTIFVKFCLSVIALILTFITSFFITQDPIVQKVIWILMAFFFIDGFFAIIYSFVRAHQKMEYEALIKTIQSVITVLMGFFVIFKIPSVVNLSYAYFFASLAVLIAVIVFFRFSFYISKLSFDAHYFKKILKNAWPLSLGFVGMWIYINLDSTMIGFLGHSSEVGWYNAAGRIVITVMTVSATLISNSFFPLLSKFFKESKEAFQRIWNYYMEIMIVLAVPFMLGSVVLGKEIIGFLYGLENYSPSVFIFQSLAIVTGISFLYYPYAIALIVADKQNQNFWIVCLGAIINIILNIILIPKYGFRASAISTIITTIITFLIVALLSRRHTSVSIFNPQILKVFGIVIFSSLVMIAAINAFLFYSFGIISIITASSLAYFFIFLILYKFVLKSNIFTKI